MAEQEQNRGEPATPFKLKEAKKRGSVAKSLELNSLFAIFGLLAVLYLWGLAMANGQLRLDAAIFAQAHVLDFEPLHIMRWLSLILGETLHLLLPLLLVIVVIGVFATVLQTGPVFSFFPLKPDIDRLNPVSGL